jgi:capsular exopolysaccharide synthesis family protein
LTPSPPSPLRPALATLEAISRRREAVLAFAAFSILGAAVVTARATRLYRASAALSVEPPLRAAPGLDWLATAAIDLPRHLGTQQERIRSRALLAQALGRHGERLRALPEYEGKEGVRLLEAVAERLDVDARPETYFIDVSFAASDPEFAARFVNDLVDAACREGAALDVRREDEVARLLSAKIVGLEERLRDAEEAVAAFERENDVEAFEETIALRAADLGRAVEAFTQVELDLARREPSFRAVESARDGERALRGDLRIPEIEEDPVVADLEERRAGLEVDLASKSRTLGPNHLEILALRSALGSLEEQLQRAREGCARRIEEGWRLETRRREQVAALVRDRERALDELGAKRREYEALRSKAGELRDLYGEYYRRESGARIAGGGEAVAPFPLLPGLRIETYAEPPHRPWRPNAWLNFGLAALVALLGGVGVAFLLESVDETVRERSDLDEFARLRPLGLIPFARTPSGRAFARVAEREPRHPAAEAFRGVRTALFGLDGGGPRTVLLTSAAPMEGKTAASVNLAITLAQAGHRTLLVDGDLRSPRLHEVFGLRRSPGLGDRLEEGVSISTLLQDTGVEGLRIVTAGRLLSHPAEALSGPALAKFLDEALRTFDRVILDSPPVGLLADSRAIASRVEATLLVARAGRTRRRALAQALETLEGVGARVAGVVLNSVARSRVRYGYGYGRAPMGSSPKREQAAVISG